MITAMLITVNGSVVANVTRNEIAARHQWKLGYRTAAPVSITSAWFKRVNDLYAEIRNVFPGARISYVKRRARRKAA